MLRQDHFLVVLTFLGVPFIIFKLIDYIFVIQGALFSLEITLLSFLAYFIWPFLVAVIFTFLLFLEILFSIAPAYHLDIKSSMLWLEQIKSFTPIVSVSLIVLVVMLLSLVCFSSKIIKKYSINKFSILLILTMIAGLVFSDQWVEAKNDKNLVSSTLSRLIVFVKNSSEHQQIDDFSNQFEPVDSLTEWLYKSFREKSPLPNKILLVVVESLGWSSDDLNAKQFSNILSQELDLSKYDIKIRDINFSGSTVPAKIRELCQRKTSIVTPDFSVIDNSHCLPRIFENIGYSSLAIHGYTGGFFNRIAWYSDLGFDQIYFGNSLKWKFGLDKKCGSLLFAGICDAEIGEFIRDSLSGDSKRQFIYWLTLNGHQPVIHSPKRGKYDNCKLMLLAEDRLCWTIQYAQVVFNEVVGIVNSNPEMGVLIVGDHSPGGLNTDFDSRKVPGIIIWPNKL